MKQREWMGYAAAVLAAGAFLAGCGNIRKLVKSDPEVGVHLPARSAQNPVAQAADTARTQKIITYRKQDGTELFITPVDVDSLSGEKMMSVAIDEVVISASNRRNLVERNGKINVEFVVSVPQELQARNWQLVVDPQLLKGADTLAFDPLVYSGDRFRTMQRREYARYDDYLGRIVDSADYFERFGDKRAYSRYMDRVVEQRTKYADAEARLEQMTPEEAMFDRQVGWTTRGERRRQYARLRRYVTATDRKVRERTSYTPDASDKFDHLNDYFAPRYRHAYTGDDVLPGGGIYTRVQGEYPVDGGREREAYIRSLTENPGRFEPNWKRVREKWLLSVQFPSLPIRECISASSRWLGIRYPAGHGELPALAALLSDSQLYPWPPDGVFRTSNILQGLLAASRSWCSGSSAVWK